MDLSEATVLVVDDEPNVLFTLQAILEQDGYQVFGAASAEGARKWFAAHALDACLLDLRLEDGDGLELLEELRGQQPDCAPIVLTGFASMESAIRATRLGAYDYLLKPCDVAELKLTVARAVERCRMARALRLKVQELEQANSVIRSFAGQLQARIAEATADLDQKVRELEEARSQLDASYQQREHFISMVIHELRGPLTSIKGYAQLLERGSLRGEASAGALQSIATQASRLARLLDDLADASRLASGRFQLEPEVCDLVELVREQIEAARLTSQRHTVRLLTDRDALLAVCDRDRVGQLLTNLLTNAIKYSDGGEVEVRLSAVRDAAVLTVRDHGMGIPPDQRDVIFQPYVRLTQVTTGRDAGGSGLGLYIARGIVDAHGGSVTVESTPGEGTIFTVRLPLSPAPAGAAV